MKNKKLIIDGVDVSGCEYYDRDRNDCFKYDQVFPCDTNCSYAAICLKEQLQCKDERIRELEQKL